MSHEFQRWLYHRQFNEELCKRSSPEIGWIGRMPNNQYIGGLGFSYGIMALNYMFLCFERGKIYRPMLEFIWANHPPNSTTNAQKLLPCTLNITALDCFSRPLSTCGIPKPSTPTAFGYEPMLPASAAYKGIFPTKDKFDLCTLATIAKKPSVWVYGNVMMYLLRLRPDIQVLVEDRIAYYVTKDVKPVTSYMTVQVRGGQPDGHRTVVPLDDYMKAIEQKADEMEALGKPVSIVYLTSIDNHWRRSKLKESLRGDFKMASFGGQMSDL